MHSPRFRTTATLAASLTTGLTCLAAHAAILQFDTPQFDRWNYPFNATPGVRPTAPTFGAVGADGFDDRDGQFILGFNTAQELPTLAPGQQLVLNSAVVTATHASGAFTYDATYDPYQTQLPTDDADFIPDQDPGRPILLSAVALRNGFTSLAFGDATSPPFFTQDAAFAFGNPVSEAARNAFAAAYNDAGEVVDISNNIDQAFDFLPFAVGTTNLSPGDTVAEGTPGISAGSTFSFDINLQDAFVRDHLEQALAQGGLFFAITSLHEASQSGGSNPNFYTSDNFDPAAIAPTLTIDYAIIPEPATAAIAGIGLALLAARRRRSGAAA